MEENNFVTKEIAKQLKYRGYNEICNYVWKGNELCQLENTTNELFRWNDDMVAAPDWNSVLDWLRRVHDINVFATMYVCEDGCMYCVKGERWHKKKYSIDLLITRAGFEKWEDAMLWGVDETLRYIGITETKPSKKVLMIVDCQYDFVNPSGSLYVKDSYSLPHDIYQIMDRYDGFIFTMDAHPYNHCSFKDFGGEWPRHCVIYSKGASIPDILLGGAGDKPFLMLDKGNYVNKEQYGAFDNAFYQSNGIILTNWLAHNFDRDANIEIDVCGVAGDYCVYHTVKGLTETKEKNIVKISVLKDLCPCIDKDYDLQKTLEGMDGVCCISSTEN